MVVAVNPGLDEAMKIIASITGKFPNLTREDANMIANMAVDCHVMQVVDRTKGIHGIIPNPSSSSGERAEDSAWSPSSGERWQRKKPPTAAAFHEKRVIENLTAAAVLFVLCC